MSNARRKSALARCKKQRALKRGGRKKSIVSCGQRCGRREYDRQTALPQQNIGGAADTSGKVVIWIVARPSRSIGPLPLPHERHARVLIYQNTLFNTKGRIKVNVSYNRG
jgi:hypothetical protein